MRAITNDPLTDSKTPVLSEEEKAYIITRIVQAGFLPQERLSVKQIRARDSSLGFFLRQKAEAKGLGSNISRLLDSVGLSTYYTYEPEAKLKNELKGIYSLEKIQAAIVNNTRLPSFTELRRISKMFLNYQRRCARRNSHSIRTVFDQLYLEYPHLSMMISRKVLLSDLSVAEVRDLLRKRYYQGEDISRSGLKDFEAGIYYKWLGLFSRKTSLFPKQCNITRATQEITGLKAANFSLRSAKQNNIIGYLSEGLMRLVLNATFLLDSYGRRQTGQFRHCFLTPITDVHPSNGKANRPRGLKVIAIPGHKRKKAIYADAVVETTNTAGIVEIKNLRRATKAVMQDLEERLSDERELRWSFSGRKKAISKRTVVIHSKPEIFEQIKDYLANKKISLFSPSDFRQSLEIVLNQLLKAGFLRTNVYAPEEVLQMYDVLSEKPYLLIRDRHKLKFHFLQQITGELLQRVREKSKITPQPALAVYSNPGRLEANNQGLFEHYTFSLTKDVSLRVTDYVMERAHLIPENFLFMDVESTGWVGNMIFLIGTAYRGADDLKIDLAFARNPWEESAVLDYFCKLAADKCLVTYNGLTFDVPAIKERLVANMMQAQLPQSHLDVYQGLRAAKTKHKLHLGSLRLDDLFELFGDKGKGVTGQQVPMFYGKWLARGDPDFVRGIIERNVKDLVTTVAYYLIPEARMRNGISAK